MCGLRKRHFGPTDYQLGGSQESSAFHALVRVVESRVYFGERLLQVGGVSIAIKFWERQEMCCFWSLDLTRLQQQFPSKQGMLPRTLPCSHFSDHNLNRNFIIKMSQIEYKTHNNNNLACFIWSSLTNNIRADIIFVREITVKVLLVKFIFDFVVNWVSFVSVIFEMSLQRRQIKTHPNWKKFCWCIPQCRLCSWCSAAGKEQFLAVLVPFHLWAQWR